MSSPIRETIALIRDLFAKERAKILADAQRKIAECEKATEAEISRLIDLERRKND